MICPGIVSMLGNENSKIFFGCSTDIIVPGTGKLNKDFIYLYLSRKLGIFMRYIQ